MTAAIPVVIHSYHGLSASHTRSHSINNVNLTLYIIYYLYYL